MALQVWLPLNGDLHNQGLVQFSPIINTNPTWTNSGKTGKALVLGQITMPAASTAKILNNQEFSFACWIYIAAATGSTTDKAMLFGTNGMGANNNRKFSIFQYPTCNDLHLSWQNDAESVTFAGGVWSGVFPSNKWTHVAITYKNPNGKIYINGIQYATFSGTSNSSSFAYDTVLFQNCPNNGRYLNDYRIYNHCLSAKEVKEISQGLVLHYKLNNEGLGGENLFNWANNITGITLNDYQNTGSFTQFTNSLNFDPSTTVGEKYTISFLAKSPNGTTGLMLYNANSKPKYFYFSTTLTNNLGTDWQYFTYTVVNTQYTGSDASTNTNIWKRIEIYAPSKMGVIVKQIKVEKGEIATPWSPSKLDSNYPSKLNTTIYDSSGFNNNGSIVNSLTLDTTSPQYLICTSFNGTSSAISVPPLTLPEITVAFWMKRNANTGTRQFMYTAWTGITCELTTSGVPIFAVNKSSYPTISGNAITTSSGWVHYCGTFSLTDGMKLYQNGVQVASNSNNNPIVYGITTSYIGLYSSMYYNGNLSDFRIYATALSADDIKKLYRTSKIVSGTTISPRSLE